MKTIGVFGVALWTAVAQERPPLDRASLAVERALPAGWSVVVREDALKPWGHHWCNGEYQGPLGKKLTVLGTRPVNIRLKDRDGTWRAHPLAKEALEVWVMPSEYSDSFFSWLCVHRPVQPTEVARNPFVRVFARPSGELNSQEEYNKLLEKSLGTEAPESPWNDPRKLSWRTWREDLAKAIHEEFSGGVGPER